LRKAKDWTVAQLAVYADMSPSAVSQIETGRRSPTAASMAKLAGALEVEVRDLFPLEAAPLPETEDGAKDEGFDSPARSYRLPAPHDLGQRRQYAERLMDTGVSEATARGVSRVDHRPEEYWRALAEAAGLEGDLEDERRKAVYQPWLEFIDRYADRWEGKIANRAIDGGAVAEFVATLEDLGPVLHRLGRQEHQEQPPDYQFTFGPIIDRALGRLTDLFNPLIEAGAKQAEESDLERLRRRQEEFANDHRRAASG
jgi:transcriptional regulator with XRE-family HTH domain